MKFVLIYLLLAVPYPIKSSPKWYINDEMYIPAAKIKSFKNRTFNLCEPTKAEDISYKTLKNCKKVYYCEIEYGTPDYSEYPAECDILQGELR